MNVWRLALCAAGLLIAGAGESVCAPQERAGAHPPISASAEPPIQSEPGARIAYRLTLLDRDVVSSGEGPGQEAGDAAAYLRPIVLRSMVPGTVSIRRVGPDRQGQVVYEVRGRAQKREGVYYDIWLACNDRAETDPRRDAPLEFAQAALIVQQQDDAPGLEEGPQSVETAPVRDRTGRERLSDALRARLLPVLTTSQRAALKQGREVTIPVKSLLPHLRRAAVEYIRNAFGQAMQYAGVKEPDYTAYSVALLPPPSSAIGIDTGKDLGGTARHY